MFTLGRQNATEHSLVVYTRTILDETSSARFLSPPKKNVSYSVCEAVASVPRAYTVLIGDAVVTTPQHTPTIDAVQPFCLFTGE